MKNDLEVKQHVLDMLKNMLMGESGSKFKPVSMEVVMAKPEGKEEAEEEGKPSLEEVLDDARMDAEDVEHEDTYNDEDEDNEEPRGLKSFMKRK